MRGDVGRSGRRPTRLLSAIGLATALAFSACAYARILRGYFFADDFFYLYRAVNAPALDLLLSPQFGHIEIVHNAFYLLFHSCFGVDPRWYFAAVLLTHLVNVALLFGLLRRLVNSTALATFGAALWGTLPCQAGTLEWLAVYGQAIATTCLLALVYSAAAVGGRAPSRTTIIYWYVLALAAATSFGVGLAMVLVLPFALGWIAPGTWRQGRRLPILFSLDVVLPALYLLFGLYAQWQGLLELDMRAAAHVLNPPSGASTPSLLGWLAAVSFQPAVPAMLARLILKGIESTLFGPFANYSTNVGLGTCIAAVLFLACSWLACDRGGRPMRLVLAFAGFSAAGYAIIAIGRAHFLAALHLQMPQVPLTQLQLPPRYHYLASLPLVVICCIGLARLARRFALPAALVRFTLVAWLTAAGIRLTVAPLPINLHEEMRAQVESGLQAIRTRIAASPPGSTVVLALRPFNFYALFLPAWALPGSLALFAICFPDNTVDGRRVVFAVSDPQLLAAATQGRRTATLVQADRPGEPPAR